MNQVHSPPQAHGLSGTFLARRIRLKRKKQTTARVGSSFVRHKEISKRHGRPVEVSDDPKETINRRSPRSFDNLGPRKILALAIHIERANAHKFRTFAESFRSYDDEVARCFEELAREEDRYEWTLAREFHRHFGETIPSVQADVDAVIEAVDLEDAEHEIVQPLAPLRVYELGLRAQLTARSFHLRAAAACQDPYLAGIYQALAAMEDDHVGWLEEKIRAARQAGEKA